jgi:hypothetical protein
MQTPPATQRDESGNVPHYTGTVPLGRRTPTTIEFLLSSSGNIALSVATFHQIISGHGQ